MKNVFTLLLLIFWVTVSSCQESEVPLEPGSTVALNRIPENTSYTLLPIIGTRWKLLGFADEKTAEIRLAEPYSDDNFILIFKDSGENKDKVRTFKMSSKGLYLFYDEGKFLLFQPVE